MSLILPLASLVFSALFATKTFSRSPKWRLQSRSDLVLKGGDTLMLVFAARMLAPWPQVGPWWWIAIVTAFALGVAGAVLHWQSSPMLRSTRSLARSLTWAGSRVIVWVALLVILFG